MSNAQKVIDRCVELAQISDESHRTTRTFLSPATRRCYEKVSGWMQAAGMKTRVDNAGNLRGVYRGDGSVARPLLIGSHLDTVRNAGAFDGILGVILGIELIQGLPSERLPFDIEIVGFSEEEGVRFRTPFIGSRALCGTLDEAILATEDENGCTVANAIRGFGLNPERISEAKMHPKPLAFLEFHIEQGPVLHAANESLAIVDSIAGQTRATITFTGKANHAGTTPPHLRKDALCAAAEWICATEKAAKSTPGLEATVGKIIVQPNISNVIPGEAHLSLDCRHANDLVRAASIAMLHERAVTIAEARGLALRWSSGLDQPAIPLHPGLLDALDTAARACRLSLRKMPSGAGHDAMILAEYAPTAMLFLRSPGGVSHHPDETVLAEDVEKALLVGNNFIRSLGKTYKHWETV